MYGSADFSLQILVIDQPRVVFSVTMATDSILHLAASLNVANMKKDLILLYNNVEYLTRGGMGFVFTANDEHNTEKILKVTPVCALDEAHALTEEFNLMVSLNHPNIAQVYNIFSVNQVLGFDMKVYPGGDLHGAILQRSFTPLQTLAFAVDILAGLAFIHWFRLVHRDIKPSNILFDSGYRGVISDFGLATDVDKIVFGEIPGTVGYIAPEVLSCMKYDTKSDIWSFIRTLYAVISRKSENPPRLHCEMVPICLQELVKNADFENPSHRKPARWLLKAVVGDEYDVAESEPRVTGNSDSSERIRLLPGGDNFIRMGRKFEKMAKARVYGQRCPLWNALRNDWRKIRRLHKQNIVQLVSQSSHVPVHTFVLIMHKHCHEMSNRNLDLRRHFPLRASMLPVSTYQLIRLICIYQ